jgi:hypothetical protein
VRCGRHKAYVTFARAAHAGAPRNHPGWRRRSPVFRPGAAAAAGNPLPAYAARRMRCSLAAQQGVAQLAHRKLTRAGFSRTPRRVRMEARRRRADRRHRRSAMIIVQWYAGDALSDAPTQQSRSARAKSVARSSSESWRSRGGLERQFDRGHGKAPVVATQRSAPASGRTSGDRRGGRGIQCWKRRSMRVPQAGGAQESRAPVLRARHHHRCSGRSRDPS